MKKYIYFAVLLIFMLANQALQADELTYKSLFYDAEETQLDLRIQEIQVIRARGVFINLSLLYEIDNMNNDRVFSTYTFQLNLFSDVSLKARINRVERTRSGGFSCIGTIESVPGSEVIFVVKENIVAGNISIPGYYFQVRYVAGNLHKVLELDQSLFPRERPPVPMDVENQAQIPVDVLADTGDFIDLMVVYTATARSAAGGTAAMENLIDLAVAESNTGYGNSGVNQRLRLVHTAEVVYSEAGFNWNTTLTRLRQTSDGYMDNVHSLRDTYGADEVVLIVNNSGSCGIGYVMQTVSTAFAPYAFAVVSRTCATGYYSFAHELGHNMGCAHDRDNASVLGAYSYSYGYQAPDEAFRTIMAYNCPGGCTRVNYWSNPEVTYGGQPMGVLYTEPLAADNRRALNNTALTVANFRQQAVSLTITSPLGGEDWELGTTHNITWDKTGTMDANVKIRLMSGTGGLGDLVLKITDSTPNNGVYNWAVPESLAPGSYLIRIKTVDNAVGDDGDFFNITGSSVATITVTVPASGTNWAKGASYDINWTKTGTMDANVKIRLMSGTGGLGDLVLKITDSTPNDGVYNWAVPESLAPGSYLIRIKTVDNAVGDDGDFFNITGSSVATITVTVPASGTNWAKGASYDINWTKTGTMDANVKIRLMSGTGGLGDLVLKITDSTPNDGVYNWTVPESLAPGSYLIRIKTVDNAVGDDGDFFNIVNPYITVTAPASGTTWIKTNTYSITWDKHGTMNANVKIRLMSGTGGLGDLVLKITDSTPNDGVYSWTVPDTLASGTYLIRIKTVDNVVGDDGDFFQISSGT